MNRFGFAAVYRLMSRNGVVVIFLAITLLVALLTGGQSLKSSNIMNILTQTTTTGLMAIGMSLVIIDRGIDLSVGGVAALSSAIGAICMTRLAVPWEICVAVILAIGAAVGLVNGLAIAVLRMPPFICTMATLQMSRGMAHFILGGTTVFGLPQRHAVFGQGRILGFPVSVLILAAACVAAAVLLRYSRFGRELYAMGGNPRAAWIAGINVIKNRMLIYVMSGVLAAVAALIITSRIMCAQVTIGNGSELDAIAAAVIGGVSMAGGEGNVVGAVIGALVIVIINNGLNLLGVSPYIQTAIRGLVIFVAIAADVIRRRKQLEP